MKFISLQYSRKYSLRQDFIQWFVSFLLTDVLHTSNIFVPAGPWILNYLPGMVHRTI